MSYLALAFDSVRGSAFDDEVARRAIIVARDLLRAPILSIAYAGGTPQETARRRLKGLVRDVREKTLREPNFVSTTRPDARENLLNGQKGEPWARH